MQEESLPVQLVQNVFEHEHLEGGQHNQMRFAWTELSRVQNDQSVKNRNSTC